MTVNQEMKGEIKWVWLTSEHMSFLGRSEIAIENRGEQDVRLENFTVTNVPMQPHTFKSLPLQILFGTKK